MKNNLIRLVGVLLIIAAIGGLIFSILGISFVWRYKPLVTDSALNLLTFLDETVETSLEGLQATHDSLDGALASIRALQSTMQTIAEMVQSTEPVVGEIAELMEEDLPETVRATQQSIQSAQDGAMVIDSVLRTLTRVPLLGTNIGYDPEVPLHEGLGEISDSVDNLPNRFVEMEASLAEVQHNLQISQVDFVLIIDAIRQLDAAVTQYEGVIEGYQDSLERVQARLETIAENVPDGVNIGAWVTTIFLVWMAIAQIGLLMQGLELLSGDRIFE